MSNDTLPGGIGANSLSDPDARPETPAASVGLAATLRKRGRGQRKVRDKPIPKARRKPDAAQRSATAKAREKVKRERRSQEAEGKPLKAATIARKARRARNRRKLALPKPSGLNNPRGGQSKYRKEFDEAARGLALLGATDEEMALAFDITETTLNAWKRAHPTFAIALRGGKLMADAQVAAGLFHRAKGYKHEAVKIFLPEGNVDENGNPKPVIVPYTKEYAPDTNAARFWLLNRRREQWRERQEVAVTDPIAAMSAEQRLANVVELMAKARALLAEPDDPEDITDAEYEEIGE